MTTAPSGELPCVRVVELITEYLDDALPDADRARLEAHLDDCRWREPSWHESKVNDPNSHRNYHLGFRCCKDR